jgi:hypothetical protein
MKNLCFALLAGTGLFAVAGCSEFTGNSTSVTTTTTSSATMSTEDPKNMTEESMTQSAPAPEANPANANADVNAIPYPAIHSNGQGAGTSY